MVTRTQDMTAPPPRQRPLVAPAGMFTVVMVAQRTPSMRRNASVSVGNPGQGLSVKVSWEISTEMEMLYFDEHFGIGSCRYDFSIIALFFSHVRLV